MTHLALLSVEHVADLIRLKCSFCRGDVKSDDAQREENEGNRQFPFNAHDLNDATKSEERERGEAFGRVETFRRTSG
ncbi:MAG: hypothetical protein EOO38_15395 [Cytophagaceae bacterium]|nr:MAG: hypothetical protein EOO38_15395 [Cytophagaceae bacterium]